MKTVINGRIKLGISLATPVSAFYTILTGWSLLSRKNVFITENEIIYFFHCDIIIYVETGLHIIYV